MANSKYNEARIIWAIDPFAPQSETQCNAILAIQALVQKQPACIEPVYVASDPKHQVTPQVREHFNLELEDEAQFEIDSWLAEMKLKKMPGLQPVHILGPTGASLREQVAQFLSYAREQGADLIVASTRARKGPSRWFFGSFVETLSLISDIPVLVVNPLWGMTERKRKAKKRVHVFDRILFPTDFSEASHEAFRQILPFAQRLKSELVLFHKINLGLTMMPESAITLVTLTEEVREAEVEMCRRNAELWIREAGRMNVNATAIVDYREGESVAQAIIKQGAKMKCLIALAGETASIETRLLGSITRQVLRESAEPVWVIHPRAKAQEARRAA